MITFLASYLTWFIFAVIPVMWWIDGRKLKEATLHACASSLLAWIIVNFLKEMFATTRPYLINGTTALTATQPRDPAFPSGHTAAAIALAVTIYFHNKKLGIVFIIAAILIGIGRVLARVHYPIDILGGAIVGTLVALTINKVHLHSLVSKHELGS